MTRAHGGLDAEMLDMILGSLRTVAERRLPQQVRLELDERAEFPRELIEEMLGPDLGLHLVFLPEEVGGLGGGARDVFRVSEEMARIDLGVATSFLAIALGVDPIIVGGTEEQRRHWLGRIAEEGLIVAYGVTEPAAGSNVASVHTTAEPIAGPDGTVRAYRLDGTKQFITNGSVAEVYTILAKTPGGPSFFVVERGAPGLSVGAPEHKHGIRASDTSQVILDGVEVPAANLLGGVEGQGLHQANRVFGYTRMMVAAFGLGAGEEAISRAIAYGQERQQFGKPLVAFQGFTHKLIVPHVVRLEAARAYCEAMAARLDAGEEGLQVEGSVAKLFATEAGNAAADAALQAHGGYGYTREYEVEKIRRDVRITTIYEGTSEIQQSIVGTYRWRDTVRGKGRFYGGMAAAVREAGGEEAAALAAEALSETILAAHVTRLPREQFAMFELARLAAEVETACALAVRAATAGRDDPRSELLGLCARLHAGATARASGRYSAEELDAHRETIGFDELMATAGGELALMTRLVESLAEDPVYARS